MNKKQAAAWRKATRRRFKNSYRQSLKVARDKFNDRLVAILAEHKAELKTRDIQRRQFEERVQEDATKLAHEIARIRLEFGPQRFGTRFQMYVTMDEAFMLNAQDLKTYSGFIVDKLSMLIKREFATIDFARAQVLVPKLADMQNRYPTFYIDTRDGLSR